MRGRRGDTETRRHGDTETRRRGDAETRRHGDAETRRRGDAETRRHNIIYVGLIRESTLQFFWEKGEEGVQGRHGDTILFM